MAAATESKSKSEYRKSLKTWRDRNSPVMKETGTATAMVTKNDIIE